MKSCLKLSQMSSFLPLLLVFFGLGLFSSIAAQDGGLDSLYQLIGEANLTPVEEMEVRMAISKQLMNSDLGGALREGLIALELAETSKDLNHQYRAVFQVASVCFYVGMEDKAVGYWLKSLDFAQRLEIPYEIARVHFNLSAVYMSVQEFAKAQQYLNLAQNYFESQKGMGNGGQTALLLIVNNQAIISHRLNNIEEAQRLFTEGLTMARDLGELSNLATFINAYVSFLMDQMRHEESLALLNELLEINNQLENQQLEATAYIKLARIYDKMGEEGLADEYLNKGYNLAVNVGSVTLQDEFADDLFKYARKTGKTELALYFKDISDSLSNVVKREEAKKTLFLEEMQQVQASFEQKLLEREALYSRQRMMLLKSLALLLGLFFVYYYYVYRSKRERQLKWMQMELGKKRLELQNVMLQGEIEKKDKELAVQTMKEIQRNEALKNLTQELQKAQRSGQDTQWGMDVKKQMAHLENNRVWEDFDLRFSEIGGDFYQRLMDQFPDLTVNERRLCAFLRLDMNTKEIVAITGQSIRAVEVARTRLRKKLNLSHNDTALNTFLINF
jgi:tetratricopeptide (TPR) repeat protein/DNA-binding CsgD family transcriptional regulator